MVMAKLILLINHAFFVNTVTYSRNVFIPLTNACRNKCYYCGFRSSNPKIMEINEARQLMRSADGASEVLLTFGEKPDIHEKIREKLKKMGYSQFIDYLLDVCRLAISMGFLPHTNAGVLSRAELRMLKRYNASMGLMLEQAVELECHSESPGKRPEIRIKTIKDAGKLRIPFTTGILIGIGEKREDRIYSLEVIADIHKNYDHVQEVIIQNFSPKKGTKMESHPPPSIQDMLDTVRMAREILPDDVTIQIPPNLVEDVYPFLKAGARDIGGISDTTPDFVNPDHPWPELVKIERCLRGEFRLRERLPIYPKYVKLGWYSSEIAVVLQRLSDREGYRCRN